MNKMQAYNLGVFEMELGRILRDYENSLLEIETFIIENAGATSTKERDSVFIKELVTAVEMIQAVTVVFSKDFHVSKEYVKEKLTVAKNYIGQALKYFAGKDEE